MVAALAAFVFFFEKKMPPTRKQNEKEHTLVQFDHSKITGLDITSGDSVLQLRKKDDQWMVVSPVQDRANPEAITPILTEASDIGRYEVVAQAESESKTRDALKDYGVLKAKVRLKLLGEGAPPEIHFGKDTAFEGKIYARLDNEEAASIIKADLRNLLVKDLSDFRDRHLTQLEASDVGTVKFKTAAGEIVLQQTGENWNLQVPLKARAANGKVLDLISSVNSLQIQEFITPETANLAKYGLAEPRGSISFKGRDGDEEVTIEVGSPTEKDAEKVHARVVGRPSVFVLPKSIGVALGVKPNDLRDNKLTRITPDLIDRITIEKPGLPKLVLTRKESDWVFLEGGQPADSGKVQRLIDILNNTEAKNFVDDTAADLQPFGLDQPVLTIRLSSFSSENTAEASKGETPLATVQFGKTEGDSIFARLAEEPFVVSVGSGVLTNLPSTTEAFQMGAPETATP